MSAPSDFGRPQLQATLKRAADVALGLVLLVVLAPVILVLAVVLKMTSSGPVFFRQPRIGRGGRAFPLLKFRTMRTDAEDRLRRDPALYDSYLANNFKLPGRDPRLTPLGRHLRKMSVDEIPQLFNVVAGHMSLVGPRPVVPDELVLYGDLRHAYEAVRPGLTGAWQVSGRSRVGYPERAMIDFHYVSGWTLMGDFKILVKTVPAIMSARGAR
ncbi:MAG: sugar transferase [Acidimicrobiales bacterium]